MVENLYLHDKIILGMEKLFIALILAIMPITHGLSLDTLYTNPNYPPIVYSNAEYKFYKYTAKYIPDNLFHSFKILGSNELHVIERFKERSVDEVLNKGIFYPSSRLRKEFCLEGFSDFVGEFHKMGIYYPRAMESFILLSFHQYLNQNKIEWSRNKSLALADNKKTNRAWRKRKRKLFKRGEIRVKESNNKNRNKKGEDQNPDPRNYEEFISE